MKKITEHTYGTHVYMKLELNGEEYEVDWYLTNEGEKFKTTADQDPDKRQEVIEAFNALY